MAEQFRCLNCGHIWRLRGSNPEYPQCPQCRKRRVIDNRVFDQTVTDLVRLLRNIGSADPLEIINQAYYHADEATKATIHDPILAGKAVSEMVKEALSRLGLPKPHKRSTLS
jgi:DNA-directed RNA polymerase subunit RPC12/RpoP